MAIYVNTSNGATSLDPTKYVKQLSDKLDKHITDTDIIQIGSIATGSVTWDTRNFLAEGLYYFFIITVNSNLNSESFKQEIECTMGGTVMGQNGNYYKLTSVFSGVCSRDNKDIIKITGFKNGGSWTGWGTRGLFIPIPNYTL